MDTLQQVERIYRAVHVFAHVLLIVNGGLPGCASKSGA